MCICIYMTFLPSVTGDPGCDPARGAADLVSGRAPCVGEDDGEDDRSGPRFVGHEEEDRRLGQGDGAQGQLQRHEWVSRGRRKCFYLTTHSTHLVTVISSAESYNAMNMCEQIGHLQIMHFKEGRKEMFYLTMHSTHFIYSYMASGTW